MTSPGILYVIPSALHETHQSILLPEYLKILTGLNYFVVENIRSARRFIKKVLPGYDINTCAFWEMDKHHVEQIFEEPLRMLRSGHSIGLISEAGCPGIADPGGTLVDLVHRENIRVIPWIGPSSILLALMASGMNGQGFTFHGYLPQSKPDLVDRLRKIESDSTKTGYTQLFIETPYRNQALLETILYALKDTTRFCIATNLTGPDEWINKMTILQWKKMDRPDIQKKTSIFLIEA